MLKGPPDEGTATQREPHGGCAERQSNLGLSVEVRRMIKHSLSLKGTKAPSESGELRKGAGPLARRICGL